MRERHDGDEPRALFNSNVPEKSDSERLGTKQLSRSPVQLVDDAIH